MSPDDRLGSLLRDAYDHASGRIDAGAAWRDGRRALRRDRYLTVLGATAAVVVAAGTGVLLTGPLGESTPAPATSTSPTTHATTVSRPSEPSPTTETLTELPHLEDRQVAGVYTGAELADLTMPDMNPTSWSPPGPDLSTLPLLVDDPVRRAALAVQVTTGRHSSEIAVRGEDGRWRRIGLDGLSFRWMSEYTYGINQDSLSPDGTMLAIDQPDGFVTVDLRDGDRRAYHVPQVGRAWLGRTTHWSADGASVVLPHRLRLRNDGTYSGGASVTDLDDGSTHVVDYLPDQAAFLPDGTVVAYRQGTPGGDDDTLDSYDATGRLVRTASSDDKLYGDMTGTGAPSSTVFARVRWPAEWHRGPRSASDAGGILIQGVGGRPVSLLGLSHIGSAYDAQALQVFGWSDPRTLWFSVPVERDGSLQVAMFAWVTGSDDVLLMGHVAADALAFRPDLL